MNYDTETGKVNPGHSLCAPASDGPADQGVEDARLLTKNVLADSTPYQAIDPAVVAASFAVRAAQPHGGIIPYRFYRGRWFHWAEGRYGPVAEGFMETAARAAADAWFLRVAKRRYGKKTPVKDGTVTNALAALKGVPGVTVPDETAAPCWLAGDAPIPAGDVIVFRNGVLNVAGHAAGKPDAFRPASPSLFNLQSFAFDFDPDAGCPVWETVVRDILGSEALVSFWQEFCGYCLVPDTRYERAVLLYGLGGNGKSTLLAPLRCALGTANCSSLDLGQFGDRFSLPLTENKLVNICLDQGGVTIEGKAEGNLKRFISGEPIATERKGVDAFDLVPSARLVVAANNWPRFRDRSNAFPQRFLVIELTKEFRDTVADQKDMRVPEFWIPERAGFVNWALKGLDRLRKRGRFEIPAEAEAAARKCWASKSASYFLKKFVRPAEHGRIGVDDLYRRYEAQTREAGYAACEKATFGKAVYALFPVKPGRLPVEEDRHTAYLGIEFVEGGV